MKKLYFVLLVLTALLFASCGASGTQEYKDWKNACSKLEKAIDKAKTCEELEEAYELAKEDEHMKTAVLHHMTGQMAEPISRISSIAQTIHDEYQTTSNEALQAMTAKVTEETAEVTLLLDQLLKAAREEIRPQRKEDAS